MATSSYRMLIMMIFLDTILIMALTFATAGDTAYTTTYGNDQLITYQNHTQSMKTTFDTSANNPNQLQLEQTFGDGRATGRQLWELFTKGIPLGRDQLCSAEDCSMPYISWLAWGTAFAVIIINIMGGIELYFIIKNKKYS